MLSLACGDDLTSRRAQGTDAASAGGEDAAATVSDAAHDGVVVVFESADEAFLWDCSWDVDDVGEYHTGTFLDLMQPLEMQSGEGSRSGILCYKLADRDLCTEGGIWFQSWRDLDSPGSGAFYATGEPFVLESPEDDSYDVHVTPPLVKQAGDVVGPDDVWLSGEPESWRRGGPQAAHLTDAGGCTAGSDIWFTVGIAGVRFSADDGDHYGFVELDYIPSPNPSNLFKVQWRPVRWGYQTEPGEPLTIPP